MAAGWPRVSADLENVFKIAAGDIDLLLPAGVEIELQHRWERELDEKTALMRSKLQGLNDHFGGVEQARISLATPDRATAAASYVQAVAKLKDRYGLSTTEFTKRSVPEIFAMAARRNPPFKESKEDVGFRDAVIFLSVVDDLVGRKDEVGALVARDGGFHDPGIIKFAAEAGVELQVFRSVEDIFKSLFRDATTYAKEAWEAKAAEGDAVESQRWARRATDFVPADEAVVRRWLTALSRVPICRLPFPIDRSHGNEEIRFSFDVRVKFQVKIETITWPQARRVKIGHQRTLRDLMDALGPAAGSIAAESKEETEVPRLVRVEASSDATYQVINFESATVVPEGGLATLLSGGMSVGP